jgi:hypothetical protein
MENYGNLHGNSNVVAYQIGDDFIVVRFRSGRWTVYTYTHASAGSASIETMKSLARQGYGLNSYISKHQPPYSNKS